MSEPVAQQLPAAYALTSATAGALRTDSAAISLLLAEILGV